VDVLVSSPTVVDAVPDRLELSLSVSCRENVLLSVEFRVVVSLPPETVALVPNVTVSVMLGVDVTESDSLVVRAEVAVKDKKGDIAECHGVKPKLFGHK
jgi:hypothetical protein